MAMIARTLGRRAPAREHTGPRSPMRRAGWDRLLGAVAEFRRMLEVIAAIERARPGERAALARAWLRELRGDEPC